VASSLDARSEGGWLYERGESSRQGKRPRKEPNTYVKTRANSYLQQIGYTKRAYESHKGYKVLVKYEELRADTLGTMKRIYSTLGIPVEEKELARVVEKHAWENIPQEAKGEGKAYRKAKPGGWREDLTPKQVEIIERITAPLLEEFYPA